MDNNVNNNMVSNTNTVVNNNQINTINEEQSYKKAYIWIGVFVGIVLLIAGILLFFLLNGSIENRNRLTCTKTTQEDGYDYSIKKYFTFDNKKMVRVYYTYTFKYLTELSDDEYNETFGAYINIDNNVGSSKYGLATNVQRKRNIVEITSYEPNYFGEMFKDIETNNKKEGYSCE